MARKIPINRYLTLGIVLLVGGGGFLGCTGIPKESEAPSTKVESPVLPSDSIPMVGQRDKEKATEEISLEGSVSVPAAASAAGTESTAGTKPKEPENTEELRTKQGKPEREPPQGPTLQTVLLFDGFVFSVKNPSVRWKVNPEGTPVRVELAKDPGFAPERIVWAKLSLEDHVQLPDLAEREEYYLRIGVFQNDTFLKDSVRVFAISFKAFSVPMLPVLQPGTTATFTMGYNGGMEREKPEHPVTLTHPFALGTYEVTNEEFALVMNQLLKGGILRWEGKNLWGPEGILVAGSEGLSFGTQFGFTEKEGLLLPLPGREKHPVVGVSWYGAWVFCYVLSLMEGLEPAVEFELSDPIQTARLKLDADGYRLPSEAEWEYAARGDKMLLYPGGTLNPNGVNFYRSGDPFEGYGSPTEAGGPTTPVGYFDGSVRGRYRTVRGAGPFGHFDLLGNVWEWCIDWFDPSYYRISSKENPLGPDKGSQRVVRGGAWNTQRQDLRLTLRGFFPPEGTSYSIGFRLARTLKEKGK